MATERQNDKVNKHHPTIGEAWGEQQFGSTQSQKAQGDFKMDTGGGTPIPPGEKLKDHPEAKRVLQPRDDDGQFTYNAVNNIELKYGPSRGKTIPPFLKGMKFNFVVKKKTPVVLNGLRYVANVDMTMNEFIELCKNYTNPNYNTDKFDVEMARKKGRASKAEKDMIARGDNGFVGATGMITGKHGAVDTKTGEKYIYKDNKLVKEDVPNFVKPKPKPPVPPQGGGGNAPQQPQQPQQPQIDTGLAKSNPVEFGKKYQNEISNIKKIDPKISEAKIINAFASGKIQSFDDLEHALNLKNNKK